MEGKEYLRFQEYVRENNTLKYTSINCIDPPLLVKLIANLQKCERPDMYSEVDGNVLILEHFAYDGSAPKRKKGTVGFEEEARLNKKLSNADKEGAHIFNASYKVSFEYLIENFNVAFDSHYKKIQDYKEKILGKINKQPVKLYVGFWIENPYPIIYYQRDVVTEVITDMKELNYIYTKQFINKFKDCLDIDFVIASGCYDGNLQMFYADHDSCKQETDIIDLNDPKYIVSPINEIVIQSHCEIKLENIGL